MSGTESDAPSQESGPAAEMRTASPPVVGTRRRLLDRDVAESLKIGRFTLIDSIGSGGMAVVYAVYDPELDRRVALKLVRGDARPELTARLRREAQTMAKLSHPNVVPVFEVGEHEGQLYIAMEYVQGRTLRKWIEGQDVRAIVAKYIEAGRGLAAAHAAGIVHRDFKADNAIVGEGGRVRVLDFGLARARDTPDETDERTSSSESIAVARTQEGPLTATGEWLGTPAYMAPEQQGGEVGPPADQFAFCVSLWEAICGRHPFGATATEVLYRVRRGEFTLPSVATNMPGWLRPVLARGLRVDPQARWPTMEALLAELERGLYPRKRTRLAFVLVSASVVIAAVVLSPDRAVNPCDDGASHLASTWNDTRRAAIRGALEGIDVGFAATTARRVDDVLSRYASAWTAGWHDACVAANVERTQSQELLGQRMRCLDDRRRHFSAVLGVLERPDAMVLEHAIASAAGLPPVDRCADPAYVTAELAPPDDPELAAKIEAIAEELARVEAQRRAGRFSEALALAEQTAARTRELGYAPVHLDALDRLAEAHIVLNAADPAWAAAREAYAIAEHGSPRQVALNFARLARILYLRNQHEDSRIEYRRALAVAERAFGERDRTLAWLHEELALSLNADARYDEAARAIERAMAIAADVIEADDPAMARSVELLGDIAMARGRLAEALAYRRKVVAITSAAFGPDHPTTAHNLYELGVILTEQGEYAEAETALEDALAVQRRAFGSDHISVANSLLALGYLQSDRGRHEEALAFFQQAYDTVTRTFGPEHLAAASYLGAMSIALSELDRMDEALERIQASLAILIARLGPGHPQVGKAELNIGAIYSDLDEDDEALAHYERARAILTEALGADHPSLGIVHRNIGSSFVRRGELDRAIEQLRKALALEVGAHGPMHVQTVRTRRRLAHALAVHGERDEAVGELRLALTILADDDSTMLPETHALLGDVLSLRGDHGTALVHYREALAGRERVPAAGPSEIVHALSGVVLSSVALGRREDGMVALAELHRSVAADPPEEVTWRVALAEAALDPRRVAKLRAARAEAEREGEWLFLRLADPVIARRSANGSR